MKKLIILGTTAVVLFFLSFLFKGISKLEKSSKFKLKIEAVNDFESISWESARLMKYQLVKPLNYSKNAIDVYGLPIRDGQWYLISMTTDCYLTPVYTMGGMGPSFIENAIRWNKTAIIDTMHSGFMSNSKTFNGLRLIHTMEILCFKKEWSIEPTITSTGQMAVMAKKK